MLVFMKKYFFKFKNPVNFATMLSEFAVKFETLISMELLEIPFPLFLHC